MWYEYLKIRAIYISLMDINRFHFISFHQSKCDIDADKVLFLIQTIRKN